jgi:hypothetical protein
MNRAKFLLTAVVISASLSVPLNLKAQEALSKKAEMILINGNKISGIIFFNNDNESLTIKPTDSIIIKVPINIIKSINFSRQKKIYKRTYIPLRFYNSTSFGFSLGKNNVSSSNEAAISAEMINGITLLPFIQLGFGIGYDLYDEASVMPFFISLSGDILKTDFTPYYFIELGTSTAWEIDNYYQNYTDAQGNTMFQLGVGYKLYNDNRMNIGFSLGYKVQDVLLSNDFGSGHLTTDRSYKRLNFKISIGF